MFRVTRRLKFDAAHRIPGHPGKCDRLHGHTYLVDVEVMGDTLDQLGILVDFGAIKEAGEEILPDHLYLNEALPDIPSTAEGLSRYLFQRFKEVIPQVVAVTVHEGPDSWCRYEHV